jgi:AsmA protein
MITGPIKLVNTKLSGFSLGSKLSAISKFSGGGSGGSDTEIQNLSTDMHYAPAGIQTQNINLTVPALGILTGAGTIGPGGQLDYKMSANLSGGMVTGLTQLAGLGNKGGSLPFFIRGTTSNPQFVPDVKGMLGSQFGGASPGQSPANSVIEKLGGLFGKKKPK